MLDTTSYKLTLVGERKKGYTVEVAKNAAMNITRINNALQEPSLQGILKNFKSDLENNTNKIYAAKKKLSNESPVNIEDYNDKKVRFGAMSTLLGMHDKTMSKEELKIAKNAAMQLLGVDENGRKLAKVQSVSPTAKAENIKKSEVVQSDFSPQEVLSGPQEIVSGKWRVGTVDSTAEVPIYTVARAKDGSKPLENGNAEFLQVNEKLGIFQNSFGDMDTARSMVGVLNSEMSNEEKFRAFEWITKLNPTDSLILANSQSQTTTTKAKQQAEKSKQPTKRKSSNTR
ncbi:MAG: hypothetical protein FWG68_10715 [Defluviitaleaceae bacterium]|nr:hypothetical protein [Defluviitaleaceae bacterium]